MYLLRSVEKTDFKDLYTLACILDSLNLPRDRDLIKRSIRYAKAAFAGTQKDKSKAVYIFVVENTRTGEVVGTSSIIARHGAKASPHSFFQVGREVRRSRTQNIRVVHRTLRFGLSKDGPTEVGGLILKPRYRKLPEKLGKQLSLIRFLYMALHPGRFKKRVLCEFLPNFSPQGKSLLWEHLGRKWTGMEYHRADRLSAVNKEFILGLFPRSKLYATLMPEEVQAILGKTGEAALPAQRMLQSVGFRYLKQICPFDGGPHFGALTRDIKVLQQARLLKVCPLADGHVLDRRLRVGLVLMEQKGRVRALQTEFVWRVGNIFLSQRTCRLLGAIEGDTVVAYSLSK